MDEQEINLLDYWRVIFRYRLLIALIVLGGSALVCIWTIFQPKIYQATAVIMAPSKATDLTLPGGLGGLATQFGISGSAPNSTDIFVSILKSRTVNDRLIDQFNLREVYHEQYLQSARKKLANNTTIKVTKEKTIEISVMDKDPRRAANLANAYVANLDTISQTMDITTAGQKKRFIEEQLQKTEKNLAGSEEALKSYQVTNKILVNQATDAGAAAGKLQGEYLANKINLETLKKYATSQNPEVVKLENQVREMEKEIRTLPPLGTQLARMMRDLKIQETLYIFLRSEYEKTQIEEARDTPRVQILDQAVVPEKKIKPSIRQNTMLAGLVLFFLSVLLVFFLEFLQKQKTQPTK
ncbi:MAG: GNVR domain-containing protein [Candidatus Omnitrophota bacterium]|nr:hypothetical protein [Candidatus Omnitrophota bacterium]